MSRAAIAGAMAEHPGLSRLYEANVPGKMSEREFWSRFLRQKTRLQQLGPTARAARSTAAACGGGGAARGAIGEAAGDAAASIDAATEGEAESIGEADVTAADPAPGGAAGSSDADAGAAAAAESAPGGAGGAGGAGGGGGGGGDDGARKKRKRKRPATHNGRDAERRASGVTWSSGLRFRPGASRAN